MLAGYLMKRGNGYKSWKKRYFVLKKQKLSYYTDDSLVCKKGELLLGYHSVVTRHADMVRTEVIKRNDEDLYVLNTHSFILSHIRLHRVFIDLFSA